MLVDWLTVVAQAVNFIVLVFLLQRFLYGPIVNAMKQRQERIIGQVEEAKRAEAEAQASRDRYESLRASLDAARETEMAEARAEASRWTAEQRQGARREVEAQQHRWLDALTGEQERFWREFEERVVGEVYDTAEHVVSDLAGITLDERIRERFLEQLAGLEAEDVARLAELAGGIGSAGSVGGTGGIGGVGGAVGSTRQAEVLSVRELDGRYQEQVLQSVQRLLGGQVTVNFALRPELLAGIELRGNGWKIGWSLRGYIESMSRRIKAHVASVASTPAAPDQREEPRH
jgi:F-type H+-transporting ATPase subunit b